MSSLTIEVRKTDYECAVTHKSMATDAMILNCGHHISEPGLKTILAKAGLAYDDDLPAHFTKKEVLCPLCSERISEAKFDLKFQQEIIIIEKLANQAKITPTAEDKQADTPSKLLNISAPYNAHMAEHDNFQKPQPQSRAMHRQREHNFNKTHYGAEWCSYRAQDDDIANEAEAYNDGKTASCLKHGTIARMRQLFSCFALTPTLLTHSAACCCGTACCCLIGSIAMFESENRHNVRYKEDEAFFGEICPKACASYNYTATLCAELSLQIFCCLPNICAPEVVKLSGLPKAQSWLEKTQKKLWKKIADVD